MYYEINVSLNGKHFFATAERSLTTESDARKAFVVFSEKFPAAEGYQLMTRRYETAGYSIDWKVKE